MVSTKLWSGLGWVDTVRYPWLAFNETKTQKITVKYLVPSCFCIFQSVLENMCRRNLSRTINYTMFRLIIRNGSPKIVSIPYNGLCAHQTWIVMKLYERIWMEWFIYIGRCKRMLKAYDMMWRRLGWPLPKYTLRICIIAYLGGYWM